MEVGSPVHGASTSPAGSSGGVTPQTGSMDKGVDPVVVSVKEVMEEEWQIMRTENTNLPPLTPHRPCRKRAAPSSLRDTVGDCKRQQPCSMEFGSEDEYEVQWNLSRELYILNTEGLQFSINRGNLITKDCTVKLISRVVYLKRGEGVLKPLPKDRG